MFEFLEFYCYFYLSKKKKKRCLLTPGSCVSSNELSSSQRSREPSSEGSSSPRSGVTAAPSQSHIKGLPEISTGLELRPRGELATASTHPALSAHAHTHARTHARTHALTHAHTHTNAHTYFSVLYKSKTSCLREVRDML